MTEAVAGFGEYDLNAFLWGDWRGDEGTGSLSLERPKNLGIVGKLTRKRHLSAWRSLPTYERGRVAYRRLRCLVPVCG